MPGGRPTKFTPETIKRLEEAFLLGCTDLEACLYADVSKSALYNYQDANPGFVERKQALKENPVLKARQVLLNALADDDRLTAHKIIERKEGTKVRSEISGPDGGEIPSKMTIEFVSGEDKTS